MFKLIKGLQKLRGRKTQEMITVDVESPGGSRTLIGCAEGLSILEGLLSHGVEVSHSCGGHGSCGTCRVVILRGKLEPRNETEAELAKDRGFTDAERLACQTPLVAGVKIRLL